MKTSLKNLKEKDEYYWEFKPFYDSLPAKLEVPKYSEHIFRVSMSHREIKEKWEKKEFTIEQAFAVAADYAPKIQNGQWRIVYFKDTDGVPCRLRVWRGDYGRLRLDVSEVVLDSEWTAGDGVLVSNETSEPLSEDTLSLESLNLRLKKLEALFNPEILK